MLNDLLLTERELTAGGIDLGDRHPDIKDMAKGAALRVRLDRNGRIASVDIVAEVGRGAAWTLRDGQHNGFPGLKTNAALLPLNIQARQDHDKAWEADKAMTSRRAAIMRLLDATLIDKGQLSTWPNAGHRKRIGERLRALSSLTSDPLTASVPATFERFMASVDGSPSFLECLLATLTERVATRGDEWLDPVRAALTGPVSLIVDVAAGDFARDAGDLRQVGAISRALSDWRDIDGAKAERGSICALTGRAGRLHTGSFPQPNLPGLGQTYIFSRNRDIPSLTRYGRTADASFPVGTELVCRLGSAITTLTQEDAKGKTWRLIPPETGAKPDLLVVSMVDPQSRLADALADDDDDEVGGEAALAELGSRVIAQSHGILEHGQPQNEMTVLVLRTVDPANRKAIYTRKVTSMEVWQAAARWQKAVANAPAGIRFPSPMNSKSSVPFRTAPFVTPLSVTRLSRSQFVDGGRRRIDVIGVSAAIAFGLFLQEGDVERRAAGMLRVLLQRHTTLLTALPQTLRRGRDDKGRLHLEAFDPKADLRRDALRSTTWIAALLYHLGRSKEVYMSGIGFRLGQLLASVDVVHVGYCADVRGGAVPMTLIGNAVFSIAGSDPHRALSILQQRWKPYGAWAKRRPETEEKITAIFNRTLPMLENARKLRAEKKDDEALKLERQAAGIEAPGWAIRHGLAQGSRFEPLSAELAADLKQVQPSDAFRAELLLGYMAGLPAGERGDTKDKNATKETEGYQA